MTGHTSYTCRHSWRIRMFNAQVCSLRYTGLLDIHVVILYEYCMHMCACYIVSHNSTWTGCLHDSYVQWNYTPMHGPGHNQVSSLTGCPHVSGGFVLQ